MIQLVIWQEEMQIILSFQNNFSIIPLFLCFKRMVSFRKLYEGGLKEKVNFFDLDIDKVNQVEKIRNLELMLRDGSKIVLQELETLHTQCQNQHKNFRQKNKLKYKSFQMWICSRILRKFILYTQSDKQKTKENLMLQAICLASLIISEMPFSRDKKFFDLEEFEKVTENSKYSQQSLEQYIKTKDEMIGHLNERLNSQGVKI
ncbi:unnamed protein product [Paramecium sonneborni]|uniref:Uncharacterized protein n=1 Tax=Paramecium sonneborni TaxID=65129 RepID=A0A8S1QEU6_9CILI|nr:unnamed protein product [Paramecium sonneborni]